MGGTLDDRLRDTPLSLREARVLFAFVARELLVLHESGIGHGAITASNIRVGESLELGPRDTARAATAYRGGDECGPTVRDDVRALARLARLVLAESRTPPGFERWLAEVNREAFATAAAAVLALDALLVEAMRVPVEPRGAVRTTSRDPLFETSVAAVPSTEDGPSVTNRVLVALASGNPSRTARFQKLELALLFVALAATAVFALK